MQRILVINDSQELLELFHMILEDEGYGVITYATTIEDLRTIEKIKPDLIILDILMGPQQATGWQTMTKLKLYPPTESIPVIICTAAEREVFEQQGHLASKGVNVVLKPFNVEDLLSAIKKALGTDETLPPAS